MRRNNLDVDAAMAAEREFGKVVGAGSGGGGRKWVVESFAESRWGFLAGERTDFLREKGRDFFRKERTGFFCRPFFIPALLTVSREGLTALCRATPILTGAADQVRRWVAR